MAISVGRNQNQIFGKIDGVKVPNIPLTDTNQNLFQKLKETADAANNAENKGDKVQYKKLVEEFKTRVSTTPIEFKSTSIKTPSKEVKVGSSNFTIILAKNGGVDKPFLVHNSGAVSRFYIPDNLYKRMQDGESKGLDTTPILKLFIRALRGEKMTQSKLNNLDLYISRPWFNIEEYKELVDKGYSDAVAKEKATYPQVSITQHGFINTYKVSSITKEPNLAAYEEATKSVNLENADFTGFRFKHPRNKQGHFVARSTDEYIQAWNSQREEYLKSTNQVVKEDVPSVSAEDYVFQPYYQGQSGNAFYCGDTLGHDIKVGFVHKLPSWSMVNTDDSHSGLPGLHVGGLEYAHDGLEKHDRFTIVTHNVFIDPQFIGAVVKTDDQYGAIRVKEYYVQSSFIAPNKGIYNSSTYGALVDEEWDKMISEAQDIVSKAKKSQELLDSTFVIE